ncbi:C40 family peptidase [Bacillus licheniformis]|uniref:C40 family peptidase n=1 Tax=Bacillus licheniformis TaxID=1402 RepID=UPI003C1301D2
MIKKAANKKLVLFCGIAVLWMSLFLTNHNDVRADTIGEKIAETARQLEGAKYSYGGEKPKTGFDSSGFVQYVFQSLDITLPRTVRNNRLLGAVSAVSSSKRGTLSFSRMPSWNRTDRPMSPSIWEMIKSSTAQNQTGLS